MIPPRTPIRTVRPASVLPAPLELPVPLWISPFKGVVASLLIVRFLSTPLYPDSPARLLLSLRFAHVPHEAAILLGDLLDREFGGRYDGMNVGAIARVLGPAHQQVTAAAVAGDGDPGDVGQPHPSRLKERRDRGACDVLTGVALSRVAAGKNRGQPVSAVPAKTNLDHSLRRARSCRFGPRRTAGGGRSACGRASSACSGIRGSSCPSPGGVPCR